MSCEHKNAKYIHTGFGRLGICPDCKSFNYRTVWYEPETCPRTELLMKAATEWQKVDAQLKIDAKLDEPHAICDALQLAVDAIDLNVWDIGPG